MHRLKSIVALLFAVMLSAPALAQGPAPLTPGPSQVQEAQAPPPLAPPVPAGGAALNRADLEAWLDGYMPFALARTDIAGAVVVVVKDGQVLVQKGYGYSDVARRTPVSADSTLFRPGSVSKLFTWTAVMQMVEQGKLDLDRDVNTYLDFKIPPREGRPVTLRNLMTHTGGFEESARYTIVSEAMPLETFVKRALPARIYPPGTTPAYSNYGTALAAYIVARASGQDFDDYLEQNIFRPLGMTRSTFRQPLPEPLKPLMSKGYSVASGEPKPFEIVGPAPAGSLSATGADMAKFMIAHLANGRGLLRPETAQVMHRTKLTLLPPLNRMALGFYEQNINGRNVIAHAGDTQYFHSDLSLFLDENVGLFISVNSGGADGAAGAIRSALLEQFADRYFPAPPSPVTRVDAETAKAHARLAAGTYQNTRGFQTVFLSILNLVEPVQLAVAEDGGLLAPPVLSTANQPRRWVEIAPFVWKDVNSDQRLAAKVENGRVVRWSFDAVSPFMMFQPVHWSKDGAWLTPALLLSLALTSLVALAWPVRAVARRRYKADAPYTGRSLLAHRLRNGFAWLALLTFAGWAAFFMLALEELPLLSGPLDPLLLTLQVLSPLVFFGLFGLAAWNLWLAWKDGRSWFAKLIGVLLLLAAAVMLWVALAFHLIGFGTTY